MNNDIIKAMFKKGIKIKAQGFQGYWTYNKEKDDIEMHCKDGSIVYLRETNNMWFTISNILYKHWEEATVENCPVLAKEERERIEKIEALSIIYEFLEGKAIMDIKNEIVYQMKDNKVNVYARAYTGGYYENVLVTKLDSNHNIIQSIKDFTEDFIVKEE